MLINKKNFVDDAKTYIVLNDLDNGTQDQVFMSIREIRLKYKVALFFEKDNQLYVDVLRKGRRFK